MDRLWTIAWSLTGALTSWAVVRSYEYASRKEEPIPHAMAAFFHFGNLLSIAALATTLRSSTYTYNPLLHILLFGLLVLCIFQWCLAWVAIHASSRSMLELSLVIIQGIMFIGAIVLVSLAVVACVNLFIMFRTLFATSDVALDINLYKHLTLEIGLLLLLVVVAVAMIGQMPTETGEIKLNTSHPGVRALILFLILIGLLFIGMFMVIMLQSGNALFWKYVINTVLFFTGVFLLISPFFFTSVRDPASVLWKLLFPVLVLVMAVACWWGLSKQPQTLDLYPGSVARFLEALVHVAVPLLTIALGVTASVLWFSASGEPEEVTRVRGRAIMLATMSAIGAVALFFFIPRPGSMTGGRRIARHRH